MVITGIITMNLFIAVVSNGVKNVVLKVSAHHQPASLCGCMLNGHRHDSYGAVCNHNKRVEVMGTHFFSVFSAILRSSLAFLFIYSPAHTFHGAETPLS
jgi:hypothetical protein